MVVNYFSVFFSIVVLTIIPQRGKLVDSIIYSDHFINRWTKSTNWDLLDRDDLTVSLVCFECRVVLLLDSHCIKDSGECNKDWITNNQYWSNWNKIWIRLDYEDGRNRRNLLEQSREPAINLTDKWRRRCGIWTRPILLEGECRRTTAPLALLPRILSLGSFTKSHKNTHFLRFMHISKWFVPNKVRFSYSFLPELLHLYKQRFLGGL